MTPRLAAFAADPSLPTPFVAVDLDAVEERYLGFRAAFPGAAVYYAVKANPAPAVLRRLASLGSSFDAASLPEIAACLAAGADPARVSFGNTVKKEAAVAAAFSLGIRLFAFDSEAELLKLSRSAPGARVYCRMLVGDSGAGWPLGGKFGCDPEMARTLMAAARPLGLDPYGLSFHVGSQQADPSAWEPAIAAAAAVASDLARSGVRIRALNIGGGFPARYRDPVPALAPFAAAVARAVSAGFPGEGVEIMAEPGRGIVAEAGALVSEVVLVSRKSASDRERWVYLDIGRFGGLAETEGEAIRYRIVTPRDGGPEGPVVVAGPTCDSVDTLYRNSGYSLPLDLAEGDRVVMPSAGAYVTSYASQSFNGFAPPAEFCF